MSQASGRAAESVRLLAVSKTHPVDRIEELYRLGQRDFGENYAQELAEKAAELRARGCQEIRWHFIGHLQTNKAKLITPWVWAVHSVDSEKLANELAKRWRTSGQTGRLKIFLEVNLDGEVSKAGLSPSDALMLAAKLQSSPEVLESLELSGLMAIPSPTAHTDPSVPLRELRMLAERLPPEWSRGLSMGMSADFEPAIREGSHWIRVGTALFGARPQA